jgi:hypothetical protein
VAYDGWVGVSNAKASGGTYRQDTSTSKAAFFCCFKGPQVDLVTATGPSRGTATLGVVNAADNTLVSTRDVNLNSATNEWQHKVSITGLDPCEEEVYYLYVVSSDGKPVVVDGYGAALDQMEALPVAASGLTTSVQAARPESLTMIEGGH